MTSCQINKCVNKVYAKQLCSKHYFSKYRDDNKEKLKEIKGIYYEQNKELLREKAKVYRKNNEKKIKEKSREAEHRFRKLKVSAKRRGIQVTLEQQEYTTLINNNCYYCDGKLGKSLTGSGLDRVNHLGGYDLNNVVPCCGICNITRHVNFTVQETKEMITALLKFRGIN